MDDTHINTEYHYHEYSRATAVAKFYDSEVDREWQRLHRYPLEFALILSLIRKYMHPSGTVIDVGGGPGRYAIWLASQGLEVLLIDLSQNNLDKANLEAKKLGVRINTLKADIVDLSTLPNNKFSLALLLGPLYHMPELKDRIEVLNKIKNALSPQGILIVEHISIHSSLACTRGHVPHNYLADATSVENIFSICDHNVIESIGVNNPTKYWLNIDNINILENRIWEQRVLDVLSLNNDPSYWKNAEIFIHVTKKK